jgi:hypothetical protein
LGSSHLFFVQADLAGDGLQKPCNQAQQRALAAAGRSDDREELAFAHFETHPVQRVRRQAPAPEHLAQVLDLDHFRVPAGAWIAAKHAMGW